jgi:hypothetical protein
VRHRFNSALFLLPSLLLLVCLAWAMAQENSIERKYIFLSPFRKEPTKSKTRVEKLSVKESNGVIISQTRAIASTTEQALLEGRCLAYALALELVPAIRNRLAKIGYSGPKLVNLIKRWKGNRTIKYDVVRDFQLENPAEVGHLVEGRYTSTRSNLENDWRRLSKVSIKVSGNVTQEISAFDVPAPYLLVVDRSHAASDTGDRNGYLASVEQEIASMEEQSPTVIPLRRLAGPSANLTLDNDTLLLDHPILELIRNRQPHGSRYLMVIGVTKIREKKGLLGLGPRRKEIEGETQIFDVETGSVLPSIRFSRTLNDASLFGGDTLKTPDSPRQYALFLRKYVDEAYEYLTRMALFPETTDSFLVMVPINNNYTADMARTDIGSLPNVRSVKRRSEFDTKGSVVMDVESVGNIFQFLHSISESKIGDIAEFGYGTSAKDLQNPDVSPLD